MHSVGIIEMELRHEAWEAGRPMNLGYNTRGVAHWQKDEKQRLFFATYDSYLWSIDL